MLTAQHTAPAADMNATGLCNCMCRCMPPTLDCFSEGRSQYAHFITNSQPDCFALLRSARPFRSLHLRS